MSKHLLDTCIIIDYLRTFEPAIRFIEELSVKPSISVVTIMELYAGARSAREETYVETFLLGVEILNVEKNIGQRAGIFLKHYEASHNVQPPDALIAATAEYHELALVTLNLKHFPMFPNLQRPY